MPKLTLPQLERHLSGSETVPTPPPQRDGEAAGDLAYRLYTLCERKRRLPYNALIVTWPEILRLEEERRRSAPVQGQMEL